MRWICEGSACDTVAGPLLPAFADAQCLEAIWSNGCPQFGMYQPRDLSEEGQEKQSGKELRAAKALACEISAHKGEPSVLPCHNPFAGNFYGGRISSGRAPAKFGERRDSRAA